MPLSSLSQEQQQKKELPGPKKKNKKNKIYNPETGNSRFSYILVAPGPTQILRPFYSVRHYFEVSGR